MSCGTAAQRVSKVIIIIIIINIYTSLFYPRYVWQTILFFHSSPPHQPPPTPKSPPPHGRRCWQLLLPTPTTMLLRWRLQWVFDERRGRVQCMYREIFASNLMTTSAKADSSAPLPPFHAAISSPREPKDYLKIPSEGVRPPGHRIFCFFSGRIEIKNGNNCRRNEKKTYYYHYYYYYYYMRASIIIIITTR